MNERYDVVIAIGHGADFTAIIEKMRTRHSIFREEGEPLDIASLFVGPAPSTGIPAEWRQIAMLPGGVDAAGSDLMATGKAQTRFVESLVAFDAAFAHVRYGAGYARPHIVEQNLPSGTPAGGIAAATGLLPKSGRADDSRFIPALNLLGPASCLDGRLSTALATNDAASAGPAAAAALWRAGALSIQGFSLSWGFRAKSMSAPKPLP